MVGAAGRELTDAHRVAQAHLALSTVTEMTQIWPLLDLRNLDATSARWIAAAVPIIDQHHQGSAVLAAGYVTELRRLELGPFIPAIAPVAPPPIDLPAVSTSLLVTGPYAFKSKMSSGMPWNQATGQVLAGSAGAAARHALTGGRDVIVGTARADPRATGLVRVTSPDACDFCIQIAEYSETNPSLLGDFECHDHCHCQPETVYG